jgi:cell division protein FtsL
MTARRFLILLVLVFGWAMLLVWLHCQYIHQCYRLEELHQEARQLSAAYRALDVQVSQLRQPHLVVRRVATMQLGLVSPFEELPGTQPVRVAQAGVPRVAD